MPPLGIELDGRFEGAHVVKQTASSLNIDDQAGAEGAQARQITA